MKKFSSKTIKVKNSVKMTALSTRAIAANLILQVWMRANPCQR